MASRAGACHRSIMTIAAALATMIVVSAHVPPRHVVVVDSSIEILDPIAFPARLGSAAPERAPHDRRGRGDHARQPELAAARYPVRGRARGGADPGGRQGAVAAPRAQGRRPAGRRWRPGGPARRPRRHRRAARHPHHHRAPRRVAGSGRKCGPPAGRQKPCTLAADQPAVRICPRAAAAVADRCACRGCQITPAGARRQKRDGPATGAGGPGRYGPDRAAGARGGVVRHIPERRPASDLSAGRHHAGRPVASAAQRRRNHGGRRPGRDHRKAGHDVRRALQRSPADGGCRRRQAAGARRQGTCRQACPDPARAARYRCSARRVAAPGGSDRTAAPRRRRRRCRRPPRSRPSLPPAAVPRAIPAPAAAPVIAPTRHRRGPAAGQRRHRARRQHGGRGDRAAGLARCRRRRIPLRPRPRPGARRTDRLPAAGCETGSRLPATHQPADAGCHGHPPPCPPGNAVRLDRVARGWQLTLAAPAAPARRHAAPPDPYARRRRLHPHGRGPAFAHRHRGRPADRRPLARRHADGRRRSRAGRAARRAVHHDGDLAGRRGGPVLGTTCG